MKDVAIEIKLDTDTENHHTIKKKEKKKKKKLSETKLIISRGTHICVIFISSINLDAKGLCNSIACVENLV